jgi:myo-inositol-1(or 4)-monophosphatase
MVDMQEYLNIAIEAARKAGKTLSKELLDNSVTINSDKGKDIKLQSDINSEKIIISYLHEKTGFSILGEESGLKNKNDNSEYLWIIDPLDGSLNFSRGIDIYCISIGLWKNNKPILGVIYDFLHDNIFYGIVGSGAFKNDNPIRVSDIPSKDKSIMLTGFPVYRSFSPESLTEFVKSLTLYKKIRLLGSAATSLAYVASGSAEVYCEERIALWDVAAGIALVLAAGGQCEYTFHKDNPNLLNVFAYNGKVKDE